MEGFGKEGDEDEENGDQEQEVKFQINPISSFLCNKAELQKLVCEMVLNDNKDSNTLGAKSSEHWYDSRNSACESFANADMFEDDDDRPYFPGIDLEISLNDEKDEGVAEDEVSKAGVTEWMKDSCGGSEEGVDYAGDGQDLEMEPYTPSYSASGSEDWDPAELFDAVPMSAADMLRQNGRLRKMNRIERIADEVKLSLEKYFKRKDINKAEYKHIMKGAVQKIYRAKNKPISPSSIKKFIKNYVQKMKMRREYFEKLGQHGVCKD